jgi:dephospho-CoA kinase
MANTRCMAPSKWAGVVTPLNGEAWSNSFWLECIRGVPIGYVISCAYGADVHVKCVHLALMLIALTGGIGCGKTSAAREFESLNFSVLDADRIVREEVLPSPCVIAAAVARWGVGVLGADGKLDRPKVAAIVFRDETERLWLERLVHPRVEALWRADVAMRPDANWIIEIPLLFEAGMEKGFDFVITVGATERVQIARLIARGLSEAQAGQRIASQLPLAHKLMLSNAVLWNDGSQPFLNKQVLHLSGRIFGRCQG